MEVVSNQVNIDSNAFGNKIFSNFASTEFERYENNLNDYSLHLIDYHRTNSVHFNYLQIKSSKKPLTIQFSDYKTINLIQKRNEIGLFLSTEKYKKKHTIWLPFNDFEYQFDPYRRISKQDKTCYSYKWEFFPQLRLHIYDSYENESFLTIPFIIFEDNTGAIFDEFNEMNNNERDLYRKSDWFYASKPLDIWNYLIHGSIYDPRTEKDIGKRFKCQQCAYSWWNYFGFLHKKTGKKLYSVIQDEIAFTVLMDLSYNGEWGHGFWSDEIETHTRFHLDGIHLLLSQYDKTESAVWSMAAEKGMDFVFQNLTESFGDGSIWFLHDTIESDKQPRIKSTVFGKSLGNSLCINTHVQALTVISRFKHIFPDKMLYVDFFEKGIRALRLVLDYQPGNIFYKPLSRWIRNHKIAESNKLMHRKIKIRLQNRLLKKIYWLTVRSFPRLVHPNGFVERDLTLSLASDRYHVTNIKDFLTLYQLEPLLWLKQYIVNGTNFLRSFVQELGLDSVLQRSSYYIEFIDILCLYEKLIQPVPPEEINVLRDDLYKLIQGYSLDSVAFDPINLKNASRETNFETNKIN